jgi:hypothetical protein
MGNMRTLLLVVLALHGCGGSDGAKISPGEAMPASDWSVVMDGSEGAFLAVWGASASGVFAVGGPLDNAGLEGLVMRFDGKSWQRVPAGGSDTFWWSHGTSAEDVWMVGEHGRMAHWDGTQLTELSSLTQATLFGVWAASPEDAWAVGGSPENAAGEQDVLLHWDGTGWARAVLPGAPQGKTLFKVWGEGSEVFVVGEAGTIWRRHDGEWKLATNTGSTGGTLLSVSGCSATDVYAAGGRELIHWDGKSWGQFPLGLTRDINGVTCVRRGEAAVVGFGGLKGRVVHGALVDESDDEPRSDLHGVWTDPEGGLWAAGGDYVTPATPGAMRQGVLAHRAPVAAPSEAP